MQHRWAGRCCEMSKTAPLHYINSQRVRPFYSCLAAGRRCCGWLWCVHTCVRCGDSSSSVTVKAARRLHRHRSHVELLISYLMPGELVVQGVVTAPCNMQGPPL